ALCELIASKTRTIRTSGNMQSSDPKIGQTTCYLNRTYHVLATYGLEIFATHLLVGIDTKKRD
ncbi:MAG: hypothetical protein NTZ22_04515, partial [Hyphomicrobiales bacterium]|nr:hypothetical protein [Hyphomicrobiales bacterium]